MPAHVLLTFPQESPTAEPAPSGPPVFPVSSQDVSLFTSSIFLVKMKTIPRSCSSSLQHSGCRSGQRKQGKTMFLQPETPARGLRAQESALPSSSHCPNLVLSFHHPLSYVLSIKMSLGYSVQLKSAPCINGLTVTPERVLWASLSERHWHRHGGKTGTRSCMDALRYKHRAQGHQTMEIPTNHDGVSALSNA